MEKEHLARVKLTHPAHFLGFGFGSGLIPIMPGTMGSLAAIPLILLISQVSLTLYVIITIVSCVIGIYICQKVSDDLKVHDHGSIVWDEIAGMMIVFIGINISWHSILLGFILFRIFDILKPWPISFLDKHVSGGFGIMIDDIVAGLFAWLCLHAIYYVYPLISSI